MDNLDDDCLVSIFKHVTDIRDQVHIARVCSRFGEIFIGIWRRQNTYRTLNLSEWRNWLPDAQDFSYFFQATRDGLMSIVVVDETLNTFLVDMRYFLNATGNKADSERNRLSLRGVRHFVDAEKSMDTMITDSDMKILAQTFPNLKSLDIKEPLSGQHLADFLQLEELYLYVPSNTHFEIENAHFEEICLRLKNLRILDVRRYDGKSCLDLKPVLNCNNLATLKVNLNPLKNILSEVLRLPKLVCLNVMLDFEIDIGSIQNVDTHDFKIYETVEFRDILKTQKERINGIAIDLYYFPMDSNLDLDLALWQGGKKLKKFCLCNCEFNPDELINYLSTMNCLEILCCRHWEQLENKHVVHFVERCPQLEHLDISYCPNINGKLLYQILDVLKMQDKEYPLHLYYLRSGLEHEVEKMVNKYDPMIWRLVKLSTEFPPGSEKGLSYVYRGYEFDFICNDM
ncbi:uncharacterized protein LOC129241364 [Anastrepha obliqua]|uniref:uncharacterized protein LOC129241364 n=1 Tax=Anastrepha obliqua TaxID=95512 RepID=UPI00240A900C|nr:uncharacterized protein LOC129241364 [Anastrepha obliqua]